LTSTSAASACSIVSSWLRHSAASAKRGDDLDETDEVGVELRQVLRWNPILEDGFAANLVHFIAVDEVLLTSKRVT
jgi:hypothetical protein